MTFHDAPRSSSSSLPKSDVRTSPAQQALKVQGRQGSPVPSSAQLLPLRIRSVARDARWPLILERCIGNAKSAKERSQQRHEPGILLAGSWPLFCLPSTGYSPETPESQSLDFRKPLLQSFFTREPQPGLVLVWVLNKRKELVWYGLSVSCSPTGIRDGGAKGWCPRIPKARLALFPWRPLHIASTCHLEEARHRHSQC